jgi:hypothetical protein
MSTTSTAMRAPNAARTTTKMTTTTAMRVARGATSTTRIGACDATTVIDE